MAVQAALKRTTRQDRGDPHPAVPAVAGRVADLVRDGADVIHLVLDSGRAGRRPARHMRDVLGTRIPRWSSRASGTVTLIARGIAAASTWPKPSSAAPFGDRRP